MNFWNFPRQAVCLVALYGLCGCAFFGAGPDESAAPSPQQQEAEAPVSRQSPGQLPEQAALPGVYKPEAERAFAEARVLWKPELSGLADAEICSDPEKAVELLDKAIALEPEYAEAYARRGLALSELGRREEAFDDLTAAIRLGSKPDYYAYRALVSMRGGDERAAARDLDYSLKKQPDQSRAYNFKGVLALGAGDKKAACQAFARGCSNGDCSFLEAAREEKTCP